MRKLEKGTKFDDFWDSLGGAAQDALLGLEPDGRAGESVADVPGLGKVSYWLDACSEGEDRGGYVTWLELHGVTEPDGRRLRLEADTDDGRFFFDGRMSVLL